MSCPAVKIENLQFTYTGQSSPCFSGLNLIINKGDRFGLFGPNGAGKTTLMSCMTGLLSVQQGQVSLFEHPIKKHDKTINNLFGLVPQDFSFYQELTPKENLDFFGAWYGLSKNETKKRSDELLEVLGLSNVANKQVQQFSGGMKRRVNLAIGVINDPSILFLDEPTVGVDVQTRHAIIDYLKALNTKGTTLVYTSHQLHEAEDLCDQVALINQGKIIAQNSLDNMIKEHNQTTLEELFLKLTGRDYRD